eukprot:2741446-Prymnesium_polylepis.1
MCAKTLSGLVRCRARAVDGAPTKTWKGRRQVLMVPAPKLRGSPKGAREWRSAGPPPAAPRAMPACPARPHAAPL